MNTSEACPAAELRCVGAVLLAGLAGLLGGCQSARTGRSDLAAVTDNPIIVRQHIDTEGDREATSLATTRGRCGDAPATEATPPGRTAFRPARPSRETLVQEPADDDAYRQFDEPRGLQRVASFDAETDDGGVPLAAVVLDSDTETSTGESVWKLSLRDAVTTSLLRNPDLIAVRGQDQVAAAIVEVAATYPWNPFVQAQLLPGTNGAKATETNYYVWLMQRFELAHQRRYREENAEALLHQVRWGIHQAELLNVAQTLRLYFTALYQRELALLANETATLNEQLLGIVERRFEAGLALPAQVTTARVAARQSRRQAHLADTTYQASLLALRQQLNVPAAQPLELAHRLSDFTWHPVASGEDSESLRQQSWELIQGRPDVLAALSGVQAACANYHLADAMRIPDLQAGPIYNAYPNGAETLGLRLQMDLPIWNTGAPLARQRSAEWQQQSRMYQQLKARAAVEAQTAIDRYERARRLAESSVVSLASFAEAEPRELAEIQAQFQAGQADILAVFATQNSLLQDRRTYLDLLNELAQSAAGVVQFTGLPPERIVVLDTPTQL